MSVEQPMEDVSMNVTTQLGALNVTAWMDIAWNSMG